MAERYSTDEVRALADEFIRFKRYVEDALENLPDMGMTESSVKKLIAKYGETSSAGFEAYADAEKAIAEMFAKYEAESAMTIASIKATADTNKSDISLLSSRIAEADSNIAGVQLQSNANGAFISMFAAASPFDIVASKGYTYDKDKNKYIFKNSDDENVDVYPADFAGIYINAMNNNYSEIRLNAKTISFGNYSSVDSSGNFYATRIFGHGVSDVGEYPGAYFADITSTMAGSSTGEPVGGDFCIRKVPGYSDGIIRDNEDLVYGLMFDKTLGEDAYSVNFVVGSSPNHDGHSVWGYNYGQGKFYPKGEWDFSSCSVSNIPLYFS